MINDSSTVAPVSLVAFYHLLVCDWLGNVGNASVLIMVNDVDLFLMSTNVLLQRGQVWWNCSRMCRSLLSLRLGSAGTRTHGESRSWQRSPRQYVKFCIVLTVEALYPVGERGDRNARNTGIRMNEGSLNLLCKLQANVIIFVANCHLPTLNRLLDLVWTPILIGLWK